MGLAGIVHLAAKLMWGLSAPAGVESPGNLGYQSIIVPFRNLQT